MKLAFEVWVAGQEMSAEARELFAEAVLCHKISAYRAAMIMSYLGVQTVLRDRLLQSSGPNGFVAGRWAVIQSDLRSDDKWDAAAFDAVQMKSPPVFDVSDDIRNQFMFWKNRRNDCAHAKANAISQPYIETFWLFVQSNLPKLVVGGSRADLLQRIQQHFDPSVTPVGQSTGPLIAMISSSVVPADVSAFLGDVDAFFQANLKPALFRKLSREECAFFADALKSADPAVSSAVAAFVASREELLLEVLRYSPGAAACFSGYPTEIRKIWHDRLFERGAKDLKVLCALLSASAIPAAQEDEAILASVRKFNDEAPSGDCALILSHTSFEKAFWKVAFEDAWIEEFEWANRNAGTIVRLISAKGLDDEMVEAIRRAFSRGYHAYDLAAALEAMFADLPALATDFRARIKALMESGPQYLPSVR
jgi:hypothetical protein